MLTKLNHSINHQRAKRWADTYSTVRACAIALFSVLLLSTSVDAAQLTLAWDASSSSSVEGYRLHYGEASGSYTANADAGNQLSYTVTGLAEGTTYYFAATAYGSGTESPYSNEVSYTVPSAALTADFDANPTSGEAPLTITFNDTSIGTVTARAWDFGDGNTSTGETAVTTYTNPGAYTVSLTVSGPAGSDTATKTDLISVTAVPTPTPVADFTASPTSGTAPVTVDFTDNSTGDITDWAWDFGDGDSTFEQNPAHSYLAAGTYTVALTVTGPGGSDTMTQTDYITVDSSAPAPNPDPEPEPDPGPPSIGLVAAYGFEELTGDQADDSSGQGNDGLISGAHRTREGRFGNALYFDGRSDWITVNDTDSLDLTTGMALELWVYPIRTMSGWHCPLLKEQTNGLVYSLCANTDANQPSTSVHINEDQTLAGGTALPQRQWTHLAATYDGATQRLYVNGSEVASQPLSGSIAISSGPLRIGGNSVWGEFFNGFIDEVRIYDRALTASEIQIDMNAPVLDSN